MARTRRPCLSDSKECRNWRTALYTRLSREDGDKLESDSIANQKALLEAVLARQPELLFAGLFVDDGYTGTNFERPEFQRMLTEIEAGRVDCVLVKDLSRFGRDYIDVGRYLERLFPQYGVRFIAVNDNIDSEKGPYDMLLPVKNVFNEQYARDISRKVRSAFQTKQQSGAFVGAFPSYGYQKDPADHNRLIVDPCAAPVVQRVFSLFESGVGKIKIAKLLNEEGIPCPSEYKRLHGERYHNGRRIDRTTYWTYTTIHRMLQNQMYAGNMEQGKAPRQSLHGKAKPLDKSQWAVVEGTHEPIIGASQWERVQSLLQKDTRSMDFEQNVSPFAGFLRCGDCGRAMSKSNHRSGVSYCCGSYKRYGPTVCTRHGITQGELEEIILSDLNQVISAVGGLEDLVRAADDKGERQEKGKEKAVLQGAQQRLYRLKKAAYEDYREGLLGREDYLRYKEDYERQEQKLGAQLACLKEAKEAGLGEKPWVASLLREGRLLALDRSTLAETVKEILIFEDRIEITYTFSDDLGLFPA